jgi:hypothetical protein
MMEMTGRNEKNVRGGACGDEKSINAAGNFLREIGGSSTACLFNQVIADVAKVYENAVLIGAVAAAKYIFLDSGPRVTYDVDILIDEEDFDHFVHDEIPADTVVKLETWFEDSDSPSHSLKHRKTGIYVDLLSPKSRPVRKKLLRFILENREETTNVIPVGDQWIRVLKPEFLIAMKLNRCTKIPRSERGLSDRIDIIKMLKTLWKKEPALNHNLIRSMTNRNETAFYETIIDDVTSEMDNIDE